NRNYHLSKLEQCNSKGIKLIQIFEDEWLFKKDIVKSKLSHLLGENSNKRVYARKCYIDKITNEEKLQFLERNHIQGSDQSTIKLGLWLPSLGGDELVAVMTFCKPRVSL